MKKIALFVITLALLGFLGYQSAHATGEPQSAAAPNVVTKTLYGPTAIITSTVFSAPALSAGGANSQWVKLWNEADVFIVGQVGSGASFVATVQFSSDNTNWANGYFWATKSDGTVVSNAYAQTVSTTGVTYIRVPVTGEYLRVKLVATGAVTPTVQMTLRNN